MITKKHKMSKEMSLTPF